MYRPNHSNTGYTAQAVTLARGILHYDHTETPEGAAARAIRIMRHGDRVKVADVVRALGVTP